MKDKVVEGISRSWIVCFNYLNNSSSERRSDEND